MSERKEKGRKRDEVLRELPAAGAAGGGAAPALQPLRGPSSVSNSRQRVVVSFGKISAKFRSFSAVSKRNFASKYAFDSIFQNLPDYLAEIAEAPLGALGSIMGRH